MTTETALEKHPICGGNHDFDQCEDFKKLTVNEKNDIFLEKDFPMHAANQGVMDVSENLQQKKKL